MKLLNWGELTKILNKMIPDGYQVRTEIAIVIDPQNQAVQIEVVKQHGKKAS